MAGWLCKEALGGSFGAQEATRMKVEKALPLSFLSTPHFLWGEGEELREPPAGWRFCLFSSEQVQKPLLVREWPLPEGQAALEPQALPPGPSLYLVPASGDKDRQLSLWPELPAEGG